MTYLKRAWLCVLGFVAVIELAAAKEPSPPFENPYVADSTYSVVHGTGNLTSLPGPTAPSHRLSPDEFIWKATGPINGFPAMYSGPYPDGKRVIWVGGYDRVAKIDSDNFQILASKREDGVTYFNDDDIDRFIKTADGLAKEQHQKFLDYVLDVWKEPFKSAESVYRFVSKKNEFYLSHRNVDGRFSLRVYGDDAVDPSSPIVLKREWFAPAELLKSKIFSVNMLSDGTVVMVTMDGTMIALSEDFQTYRTLKLPRKSKDDSRKNQDFFTAFVRNGMTPDDHAGILVVTLENLHRAQWTGTGLSLDEADGGWTAPYPHENGIGSGGTPQPMGWGPQEDHLVALTDGSKNNKLMLFWRDAIPVDWKGLPGYDRRVAGVAAIHFGVSKNERIEIENTPVIFGHDAFVVNTLLEQPLKNQGSPSRQWIGEMYSSNLHGYEAKGGAMFRWDPKTRTLKQIWNSQRNFAAAVPTVSSATNILYSWGARNGEWTLEGTEWNTGKSLFHYVLGDSVRYSPMGGVLFIQPDGGVTCSCGGSFGIIHVKPRAGKQVVR